MMWLAGCRPKRRIDPGGLEEWYGSNGVIPRCSALGQVLRQPCDTGES
ncbi:hypothetical protein [Thermogemmata fonticola]|uniref:Uncharacterized protein n=1 Tax=Thermogemmata fonticola TaxID=2755323 RepID=A0A7V9AD63_9BACT|nr:hypothetical protein [Thermogemmata fonticola]MBA2227693.1 hypothetical protein [Thermogemmata fonticola]